MRATLPTLTALTALAVAGCGSSSGGSTVAAPSPAAVASQGAVASSDAPGGGKDYGAASAAPVAAVAGTLKISGFHYSPSPLTVSAGQVVSVTNSDSAAHTATSDVAGLFKADDVERGKNVTFKAPTKAGTYTFFCEYHSSMHGTLIVK